MEKEKRLIHVHGLCHIKLETFGVTTLNALHIRGHVGMSKIVAIATCKTPLPDMIGQCP